MWGEVPVHFDRKKDDLFKNQLGDNTIAKQPY